MWWEPLQTNSALQTVDDVESEIVVAASNQDDVICAVLEWAISFLQKQRKGVLQTMRYARMVSGFGLVVNHMEERLAWLDRAIENLEKARRDEG